MILKRAKSTKGLGLVAMISLLTPLLGAAPVKSDVPAFVKKEAPPIYKLKDIKRGQRGHGYTVFASARGAEPFEFEVLGVMKGFLGPGEDLIVVKLIGEQIEKTGVISGMSGSPTYIDGKLVGAVGYRLGSFTKDAIAGITPIERMLQNDGAPRPRRAGATEFGEAVPIQVPIATSSLAPHVAKHFEKELLDRGYGRLLAAGSAAGAMGANAKGKKLFAAGPVAGVIVRGDINMAGIGTVTWVKGNKFLAFGHPFMGMGESNMPIADAHILTTVASQAGSYKMGQATHMVGRLTNDRLHAITGLMGEIPSMIPVEVKLDLAGPRVESDARKVLRYEVYKHPTDAPLFGAIALANALAGRVGTETSGGTAYISGKLVLKGGRELPFATRAVSEGSPVDTAAASALMAEWNAIQFNGFEDVEIEKVFVKVKTSLDINLRNIMRVSPRSAVKAGQKVRVDVEWLPYKKRKEVKTFDVRIPAGIAPGKYKLTVAGKIAAARYEASKGMRAKPETFDQLIEVRESFPEDGSLSFYLSGEGKKTVVDGRSLELPGSYAGLLEDTGYSKTRDGFSQRLARNLYEGVIAGDASATLYVEESSE